MCNSCDYRACFKNDLEKHMRAVHGIMVPPGEGDSSPPLPVMKTEVLEPFIELGKSPADNEHKTSRGQKRKAISVSKKKNYFCDQCDYKTSFKSDLLKHDELVHQKIKKSCPHCGKQVANLHEHIRLGSDLAFLIISNKDISSSFLTTGGSLNNI